MRLRRSWVRWLRTRRLTHRVRRLRKQVQRQTRVLELQLEMLRLLELLERLHVRGRHTAPLLEQLEHPLQLVPAELLPTEPTPPLPETLDPPEPLTPEELAEMREWAEKDPLEEIRHRLAPSTTPSLPPSWEG